MEAVFGAMACQLQAGERVAASGALFVACNAILTKILPRWAIQRELIDGTNLAAWENALAEPTKLAFLESPSNLLLNLVEIKAVATLAHKAVALVMVDNVFASPIYQRPPALSADIVVSSTTQHIDGQGRLLGGAVFGQTQFCQRCLSAILPANRAAMSAFNVRVMLKSLETLLVRVATQSEMAAKITAWLFQHPKIKKISYSGHASHSEHNLAKQQMLGFGSLLPFEFVGSEVVAITV